VASTSDTKLRQLLMSMSEAIRTIGFKARPAAEDCLCSRNGHLRWGAILCLHCASHVRGPSAEYNMSMSRMRLVYAPCLDDQPFKSSTFVGALILGCCSWHGLSTMGASQNAADAVGR
jgi:hypothetical protein